MKLLTLRCVIARFGLANVAAGQKLVVLWEYSMQVEQFTLENGLRVLAEINPGALSTAIGFFVRTGSRDEVATESGVSHFLEHMLFKGTEKRSVMDVNLQFDQMGAKYNAFTSEENTVYYACVLPEYQGQVTELWADLLRPSLRQEDFDIEKGVILEEIAMYKDLPHFEVVDRCRTQHYGNFPAGNSVLGSVESIKAMTSSQMRDYFQRRYSPDNIILACSGKVDLPLLKKQVQELCGWWQPSHTERKLADYHGGGSVARIGSGNVQRDHICMITRGPSAQDPLRYAAALLAGVIGDEGNSRMHWALVDNALTDCAAYEFESMDGLGHYYAYISCDRENSEKVIDITRDIIAKIRRDGITADELEAGRNKLASVRIISGEVPMGRLVPLGMDMMYRGVYSSVKNELDAINNINMEQVRKVIDLFPMDNLTITTLGPE